METMNKVTLNICGTDYIVTTDEAPGYMQELGAQVDARIRNLMNSNERTSLVMATVMTALMQADEAKKATHTADNLRKQLKTFFDDNNRSRVETENLRREVQRLKREKEELERKLAAR
ncbi:MAG: cell division protein ZapA [Clostridia bacterium]|nr:cell division protein ZapA [Loktanella sp.]MBQ1951008.1 cell division protein ZapA [Clostridia bacterium]